MNELSGDLNGFNNKYWRAGSSGIFSFWDFGAYVPKNAELFGRDLSDSDWIDRSFSAGLVRIKLEGGYPVNLD